MRNFKSSIVIWDFDVIEEEEDAEFEFGEWNKFSDECERFRLS